MSFDLKDGCILSVSIWLILIMQIIDQCNVIDIVMLYMKNNNVGLCCPIMMSATTFAWKRCSVPLYLQLFVGGLMFYLRNLCLATHSAVQHILWFFFCCFSSSCCRCLWLVPLWLPLRCSLTFIWTSRHILSLVLNLVLSASLLF